MIAAALRHGAQTRLIIGLTRDECAGLLAGKEMLYDCIVIGFPFLELGILGDETNAPLAERIAAQMGPDAKVVGGPDPRKGGGNAQP